MTDKKTNNTSTSAPFSTKQTVQIDKGLHGAGMLKPQAKPATQTGSTTTKHKD